MATYLLLRNNKESGPLSFDELIKIGLKPYDLVWVNGRSAAWRYPSEIKELVPYAPVVEEQPYDRFYQKSTEQNPEASNQQPAANKPPDVSQPEIIKANKQEIPVNPHPKQKIERTAQTNKNVFVSFPERITDNKPVAPVEYERTKEENLNAQRQSIQPLPVNEIPGFKQSTAINRNEPIELEEKYSQPLDEIKEMYVQTLNQRKKRNARKQAFLNGLKIAAAVLVILSVGMLIGMYFDNDKQMTGLVNQPGKTESNKTELGSTSFVSNSNPAEIPADHNPVPVEDNYIDYQVSTNEKQPVNLAANNKKRSEQNNKQVPYAGSVTDSQTNERKRVIRDDDSALADKNETTNKKSSIENIWDDVSIKANDFKTGPFGGIKDLTITLANNSSYPLDKVEIEVKYIGLEKQVVKTQNMVFNDVVPGGQVHADVPRTGRGMDVDVSIKKINVRDFSFARSEK